MSQASYALASASEKSFIVHLLMRARAIDTYKYVKTQAL